MKNSLLSETETIETVITQMMDRVMEKVLVEDPFKPDEFESIKPIYAALVPMEIFKGAHFERRFVTPFGKVWERLAEVIAKQRHRFVKLNHKIDGYIPAERLVLIQETLDSLEFAHGRGPNQGPCWDLELEGILEGGGDLRPVSVNCDLYVSDAPDCPGSAYELKAPLPNSDQTKVSKEKMLKLHAMEPKKIESAYYALPYNPYGENKADYAWAFPQRWFDMQNDACVLIGPEFWELIGDENSYREIIETAKRLGEEYKKRIREEYLGINLLEY